MEEVLNRNTLGRGISFLDPIEVTDVQFGQSYPIFTNARVRPADASGRMRVEVDVDYSDLVSLSIDTKVLINVPRPRFAVLPLSLGLVVERFSGTLALELVSSPHSPPSLPASQLARSGASAAAAAAAAADSEAPRSRHQLRLSLHPDFELDARATSLVGSRAKLQDVPKIEQLLVARLRAFVHDRFVWPRYWSVTLPNLVPRRAAGPQRGDEGEEQDDDEDDEEEEEGVDEDGDLMQGQGRLTVQRGNVLLDEQDEEEDEEEEDEEEEEPHPAIVGSLSNGLRHRNRPGRARARPRPTLTHSQLRASQQQQPV
ncbi:hypothetical protein FA10DRAFT_268219 [Acaromyces ingoldii]|uniref:SMP-LTD domain-containing protein n=1 Tax=Acaromyces ingoldii TaxID=215250 RepID=A0A316YNR3_9BASI|nr:hypothetical protein FA10DRAFT_268219 [Acaromyces ingoldii]PWN89693.1 hypothetical protein FA10DRAFT_268219 [Acaromyces ingoldii]